MFFVIHDFDVQYETGSKEPINSKTRGKLRDKIKTKSELKLEREKLIKIIFISKLNYSI